MRPTSFIHRAGRPPADFGRIDENTIGLDHHTRN